jgi:glucose-1-phosphate cytidylyltransferase
LKRYRLILLKKKSKKKDSYINGGYFVLSPKVLDYIDDDSVSFEKEPIEKLSEENELSAYLHDNFWQCMDTLRDKKYLEDLWNNKKAPWKIWN